LVWEHPLCYFPPTGPILRDRFVPPSPPVGSLSPPEFKQTVYRIVRLATPLFHPPLPSSLPPPFILFFSFLQPPHSRLNRLKIKEMMLNNSDPFPPSVWVPTTDVFTSSCPFSSSIPRPIDVGVIMIEDPCLREILSDFLPLISPRLLLTLFLLYHAPSPQNFGLSSSHIPCLAWEDFSFLCCACHLHFPICRPPLHAVSLAILAFSLFLLVW